MPDCTGRRVGLGVPGQLAGERFGEACANVRSLQIPRRDPVPGTVENVGQSREQRVFDSSIATRMKPLCSRVGDLGGQACVFANLGGLCAVVRISGACDARW